jgi:hypothetical protein
MHYYRKFLPTKRIFRSLASKAGSYRFNKATRQKAAGYLHIASVIIFKYPIRLQWRASFNAHYRLRNIETVIADLFENRQKVDEHQTRVKAAFTASQS